MIKTGFRFECFLYLFLFILFTSSISPQDISGSLTGLAADTTGIPLSNVNISVRGKSLQGLKGTPTDHNGIFTVYKLPPGSYMIRVSSVGFRELNVKDVQIRTGQTTNLGQLILERTRIDMPEITVSGRKQIIDPVSTSYGGHIRSADFDKLPVDRNSANLVTLMPQVNASYYGDGANVGGATGYENKYFVDGFEVTDPLIGRDGTRLPYNFIQEVQVKDGGYNVDTRSSLGGLINVITYSGSNEFHGSVFGFYTSSRFVSNQKYGKLDVKQGAFTDYDIGFGLGGPVIRDKLWFYAAYNPTSYNRDVAVPDFGTYVDKTLIHSFAGKLTWLASDNLNFIFTVTGDPTREDAVGRTVTVPPAALITPDPYLMNIGSGGINYSLTGTYALNENISLEAMAARVDRHDTGEGSTGPGRNEIQFIDNVDDYWSGGVGTSWDSFRHSTAGRLSTDVIAGNHLIKGGIEYKTDGVNNIYDYNSIVRYDSAYFEEYVGKGFGEVSNRIPSVFIQDSWRIFESLNIRAGIRWDGHYIIGSNQEVAQTLTVPLQPRIGIVFLPDKDGSQRIFGSFGRYSQEFGLFQSVNYQSGDGYDYGIRFYHDPRVNNTGGDTTRNIPHVIRPEIKDLQEQYYDEFSLGYERLILWSVKAGIQGVYRTLRQAIDDVWLPEESRYQYGNPGSGILSAWPKPQRDYTALIITIERSGDEHFNFLASYVLSRDYGNYEGLFDASYHGSFPNANSAFDDMSTSRINTTGLVPNDRTHVFKFSGSYSFTFGLSTGISFLAASGTPLSELGYTNVGVKYLSPRGSAGRTPAIWDLNARFTYKLEMFSAIEPKLILDLFHIASQRKAVDIDQRKYFADENGNPVIPNSTYGQVYGYQPAFSLRFGIEVNF